MKWLWGFCLVTALAHGEGIELDVPSSSLTVSNHSLFTNAQFLGEPPKPYRFLSEMDLRGDAGRFTAQVLTTHRFAVSTNDGLDRPVTLEKKTLSFETEHWKLVAGDSHLELGRGIALSLFRDPVLGLDNTLEGGYVKFSPDGWDAQVFGGRALAIANPVAINPMQSTFVGRTLWLAGGAVKRKWNGAALGGHYLLTMNRRNEDPDFDKRWHTAGANFSLEQFAPGWDLYAESNFLAREPLGSTTLSTTYGRGSYASLIYSPGAWKLKLEGKDYGDYFYDFQRPPTLEEDVVTTLNFNNVTAGRFWAERRLGVYEMVRTSLLFGHDRIAHSDIGHAVVSGKWKLGPAAFEARAGYRWIAAQEDLIHGDIKTKLPTWQGQAFEFGVRKLYRHNNFNGLVTLDDRNFVDFGYTFSSHWSLTAGYEFVPSYPVASGQHFANVGTLVKYDGFSTRASVGSTSGGPQCSGGICRLVPAYSGFLLESTLTL
ncbi:hypothetical protein K2X33_12315 [bacterium]|nr:hypothetical protein [bacterium]